MQPTIAVIGLGYVGLPLAVAFSKHFDVIGYDHDAMRIRALQQELDVTGEISRQQLRNAKRLTFTEISQQLVSAQFYIVALPTPINHAKQPDLSALFDASATLGKYLKIGDIVVYESTVYPGATEEDCIPILEKNSELICGKDFYVGYSPERVSPGDQTCKLADIVKIISAQDSETLKKIEAVYSKIIIAGLYKAPDIRTAEAAKLIENVQRDLNVALLNEVAMIFNRMKISTQEVLKAANTKWNFLPFTPGLVGGHCIGVDPYYLTYKAVCYGYHPQVILAGRRVNDDLGKYIAEQTVRELVKKGVNIRQANIILFGIAFKQDCPDIRNSRVRDVYKELVDFGANVFVHDPVANSDEVYRQFQIQLTDMIDLPKADAIVLAVAHRYYRELSVDEYQKLLKKEAVLIDVKGILNTQYFRENGHTVWAL